MDRKARSALSRERHQRLRFARAQAQREDVADVRGSNRASISERIAKHAATDVRTGRPCRDVCRGPVPGGYPSRDRSRDVRSASPSRRNRRDRWFDRRCRWRRSPSARRLIGPAARAPRDLDDASFRGGVGERVDVAEILRLLRGRHITRDQDAVGDERVIESKRPAPS